MFYSTVISPFTLDSCASVCGAQAAACAETSDGDNICYCYTGHIFEVGSGGAKYAADCN